jgi:thiol-disulfide isomerase/thioredoxin
MLTILLLGGCSSAVAENLPPSQHIQDLGPAPELDNEVWLNTKVPLKLADLRGQVVLLEMWTFGCYNCQNVIPYIREWHDTYSKEGLVVIGNHYPEFSYERDIDNLRNAIQNLEISYPVAVDNDGETWRAYNNRYWPTRYLIDKKGHIRFVHIGKAPMRRQNQSSNISYRNPMIKNGALK